MSSSRDKLEISPSYLAYQLLQSCSRPFSRASLHRRLQMGSYHTFLNTNSLVIVFPPWSKAESNNEFAWVIPGAFCEGKIPKNSTTVCLHLSVLIFINLFSSLKSNLQKIVLAIFIIGLVVCQTGYWSASIY